MNPTDGPLVPMVECIVDYSQSPEGLTDLSVDSLEANMHAALDDAALYLAVSLCCCYRI